MIESHDEFLDAFERCALPAAEWTHAAHIRMAWIYLTSLPFTEARDKMRAGIRRYNTVVLDVPHKYHDTVTIAYAHIIASRIVDGQNWSAFKARNSDLFDPKINSLYQFYSAETLATDAARCAFVAPDKQPLPRI